MHSADAALAATTSERLASTASRSRARPVGAAARAWMWSRLATRSSPACSRQLFLLSSGPPGIMAAGRGPVAKSSGATRPAARTIDHALSVCTQGEVGRGMLRLAEALETAPSDAVDLKQAVRANLADWSRHHTQLTNLLEHSDRVHFVAFSPDGRTAVTASPDGTARLWDAITGEPRGAPLRHRGGVMQAAFSPDSRQRDHRQPGQDGPSLAGWTAADPGAHRCGTEGPFVPLPSAPTGGRS